jgi:CDP-glycerol glycerophosphotransferase
MPTFREHHHAYAPVLDLEWLADELGAGTVVLQRVHYFYTSNTTMTHPRVRDVTGHPCVEDLLLAADILITDYSSVMFDYAVLDRPMVIYAPDWDTYRRTRGVTFDLFAEPPGVVAETFADLVAAFHTGAVGGDVATKARARFRERFCALEDGGAAERAVRRIFDVPDGEPAADARTIGAHAAGEPAAGPDAADDVGEAGPTAPVEPTGAPLGPPVIRPAAPRTP